LETLSPAIRQESGYTWKLQIGHRKSQPIRARASYYGHILLEKGSNFTQKSHYNNVYLSEPLLKIQVCGNTQVGKRAHKEFRKKLKR
jgi:hypothetical protein